MPRQPTRQRVLSFAHNDFSGGLNVHCDAYHLAENETPDCLNVQIMQNGGIQLRKPLVTFSDEPFGTGSLRNIWTFYGTVGQIVVQTAAGISYSSGSGQFVAATQANDVGTITGRSRAATMSRASVTDSSRLYIQRNSERRATVFDGTTVTMLADAANNNWNENLASPAGGKMPKAKYVVTHNNYLFHAHTSEGTGNNSYSFPHRVRWSHPGEPEDYRQLDYVDVGLDDGDQITGLASFGSSLFIFKNRSVWVLSGYDPDTFQLTRVADEVGAVSQEAIAVTPVGLFFFDGARGMFVFRDGRTPEWLWTNLHPLLDEGKISRFAVSNIVMGWLDSRLFVGVPWNDSSANTRTFVFDPQVGRKGAWYPFEFGTADNPMDVGPMTQWRDGPDVVPFWLLIGNQGTEVLRLSATDGASDGSEQFGFYVGDSQVGGIDKIGGATTTMKPFVSYYKTAWFAGGMPTVRKRWRRPSFIVDADTNGVIGVETFHNYSANVPRREQTLTVESTAMGEATWGVSEWGDFMWGNASMGDQTVVRGTALGSAYSVQLKFTGPSNAWGVNGIEFRYLPRRVR